MTPPFTIGLFWALSAMITCFLIFIWLVFFLSRRLKSRAGAVSYGDAILYILMLFVLLGGLITAFGPLYQRTGIINSEGSVVKDHDSCLYFSAVTFTTLGYGDFRPTEQGRGIAAAEAIVGYIFLGLAIGTTLYLLGTISEKHAKKTE
ncbi:hypothetical protein ES703_107975 [subsurface metagenome]